MNSTHKESMAYPLTKADMVFKHRVLWCAIAEKLRQFDGATEDVLLMEIKADVYAERFGKIRPSQHLCFLCDFSLFAHPEGDNCSSCPLLSKDQPFADMCLNGLYFDVIDYFHMHDFQKASETALKIAFLPVVN